MIAPTGFVDAREKLVALIAKTKPTLSELVCLLKKNGFQTRQEMEAFIFGWDVFQYVTKNKQSLYMQIEHNRLKEDPEKANKLLDKLYTDLFNPQSDFAKSGVIVKDCYGKAKSKAKSKGTKRKALKSKAKKRKATKRKATQKK